MLCLDWLYQGASMIPLCRMVQRVPKKSDRASQSEIVQAICR